MKCLLNITKIFNEAEGRYIFNQLFIDQYVVWVQTLKENILVDIIEDLQSTITNLTKDDLNLEISELEAAAEMVQNEEKSEIVNSLKKLNLSCSRQADDKDSDDSSADEDDDGTSSESNED